MSEPTVSSMHDARDAEDKRLLEAKEHTQLLENYVYLVQEWVAVRVRDRQAAAEVVQRAPVLASEEGRPLGTQISLFYVSDLRRPARLRKESLGLGWSEAESDHHAFLFWPRTGLVVIPFEQRAMGFRVGRTRGIDPAGRIEHEAGRLGWTPGVRRSMVVRESVLTVSDAGVKSSSLATLAERGWAAFPPAEAPKP